MHLLPKSVKIFNVYRLLLHMGPHTVIASPATLTDQDQLLRRKWAITLIDHSFGCVIKELEMWNKWRRLIAEHELLCSMLSLTPDIHGSFWLNPVGRDVFSSICNDQWGTSTESSQLLPQKAEQALVNQIAKNCWLLHRLVRSCSSPWQMPTALSSMEKKWKVGKKTHFCLAGG